MKKLEQIVVTDRNDARNAYHGYCDFVSICDPDHEPVHPREAVVGARLDLHFADVDFRKWPGTGGDPRIHSPREKDAIKWGKPLYEWELTKEQAEAIVDFAVNRRQSNKLVVHCHFGLSRSPSFAFAIADCLGLPREQIKWKTCPQGWGVNSEPINRHVYNTIVDAFVAAGHKPVAATQASYYKQQGEVAE